jgi:hypothetical protein
MNGITWRSAGLFVILGFGLTACTVPATRGLPAGDSNPYPPPGFTHQVSSSAVELFWNCTRPQPDTLVLEGLAFNPRTASDIRRLEFALVGVDARGATLGETSGEPQNLLLGMMRSTPFQLALKTTGSEARFDLFYRFYYTEPGEGDGHEPTHSLLQGGAHVRLAAASGPILLAQMPNNYLMVRDACSDTQHRMR